MRGDEFFSAIQRRVQQSSHGLGFAAGGRRVEPQVTGDCFVCRIETPGKCEAWIVMTVACGEALIGEVWGKLCIAGLIASGHAFILSLEKRQF